MRWILIVLGSIQIAQVLFHLLVPVLQGEWSAGRLGAVLDEDMVKLTAAVCALSVAGLLKRRDQRDAPAAGQFDSRDLNTNA
jgi:hypothetical protein